MRLARNVAPALAIAGALLAAGCGSDNSADGSRTAAPGNPVDRAFVAHMIPHHHSAVQMAKIAQRRGQSAFDKQLADAIVRTQTEEIAVMHAEDQRLQRAGIKKGSLGVPDHMMGMDGDVASLGTAMPFDAAFMRMMIPHHQGAVTMAKAELKRGKDPALTALAKNIVAAQQREIRQMREHLDSAASGSSMKMHGAGHSG